MYALNFIFLFILENRYNLKELFNHQTVSIPPKSVSLLSMFSIS